MKISLLVLLVFLVALSAGKSIRPDRYLRAVRNPTVCNKGHSLRGGKCWKPCPRGYSAQWNNWYRCQRNCLKGEVSRKGRCYTKRCPKGYRSAAGRCYAIACPRGWVPLSLTHCQRPCPRPYKPRGRKCVNSGAKPGQCDSYTRPSTKRANRPWIVYPQKTIPRSYSWPRCLPRWDMFPGRKCRGPCRKTHVKKGIWCKNRRCFTKERYYTRAGPKNPHVCPKGYDLRNVRCWRRCPPGWSNQWNNWHRCQRNCKKGESHRRGVCYTKRCPKGWHPAGPRCYLTACPRGYVPWDRTKCVRICPRPYKPVKHKCVNRGAKPGQCDSYTRPMHGRASRPFITYRPPTTPKHNRYPSCPGGWRMENRKCRKLCKPQYTIIRGGRCELTICIGI